MIKEITCYLCENEVGNLTYFYLKCNFGAVIVCENCDRAINNFNDLFLNVNFDFQYADIENNEGKEKK